MLVDLRKTSTFDEIATEFGVSKQNVQQLFHILRDFYDMRIDV
jgi:hypothetical protein